jgi:xanthine dehydrogenase molybdenum-binding subunit
MTTSVVGKRIPKVDSKEKALGTAEYAGDMRMKGMLYGKVVRCLDYAHAKVKSIDFREAQKVPGVVKCLGPEDVTKRGYNTTIMKLLVPEAFVEVFGEIAEMYIFNQHVKYQGDAVCGIIAETEEAAERAAAKVKIKYEPLPVYMTAAESKKPGAYQFTHLKPGNLAAEFDERAFPDNAYGWPDEKTGKWGDALEKDCDVVVDGSFYVPKQKQCQMENHCSVALYDDRDRLTCWSSSQMPKLVQVLLAELFELPLSRTRYVQTIVGGGFGARLGMVPCEPHACAMAMAVPGRPVKVEFTREEDWLASESRFPGKYDMKMGFKKDGTPVFVEANFCADKGGYYTHGNGPVFCAAAFVHGMYKWQTMRMRGQSYYTNNVPCGAFRGYGNPQTSFVQEQLVEEACAKLGIDSLEWRKKWHKTIGDETWLKGVTYASDDLNGCIDIAIKDFKWYEKKKKYANQKGTKRRGIGVAIMNHTSGAWPMLLEHTVCTAKLNEDCTVEIMQSVSDLGTGGHTAITQMAAETLGWPMEDIHLKSGDSDVCGFDIGAHASRTVYCGGPATIEACESIKKQLLERASQLLEARVEDLQMDSSKIISVKGNAKKSIDAREISKQGVYNFFDPVSGKQIGIPGQIQGYSSFLANHCSPPMGVCMTEVEVDTETGQVKLIELVNAHDIGKAIHPPSVEGQLEGGAHQGLGMVLTEDIYYDKKGLCLNNDFTDYKMLGPADMPKAKIILVETAPDPIGPMGAKSCGESALMGPIGSAANAIADAIGIRYYDAPITPERILQGIRQSGKVFA